MLEMLVKICAGSITYNLQFFLMAGPFDDHEFWFHKTGVEEGDIESDQLRFDTFCKCLNRGIAAHVEAARLGFLLGDIIFAIDRPLFCLSRVIELRE